MRLNSLLFAEALVRVHRISLFLLEEAQPTATQVMRISWLGLEILQSYCIQPVVKGASLSSQARWVWTGAISRPRLLCWKVTVSLRMHMYIALLYQNIETRLSLPHGHILSFLVVSSIFYSEVHPSQTNFPSLKAWKSRVESFARKINCSQL